MAEAVLLGDLSLDHVTDLAIEERRKLSSHAIPGWDGDLVQDLGAAAVAVRLRGVAFGEAAATQLESLRGLMQGGSAFDFTTSAAVASAVEQVLVRRLQVTQQAEHIAGAAVYRYELDLLQFVEPPPPLVGGFDAGFLDELGGLADAAALDDLGGFLDDLPLDELSSLDEALAAVGDASAMLEEAGDFIADVADAIDDVVGVLGALEKIQKLVSASEAVISAIP